LATKIDGGSSLRNLGARPLGDSAGSVGLGTEFPKWSAGGKFPVRIGGDIPDKLKKMLNYAFKIKCSPIEF